MKFCRDCSHFNEKTDNCQHPDHSPIIDVVSGTRGHIQAEVCRALNVICGTYAWKFEQKVIPIVTDGTIQDWEAA